jgi:sugar phosphate permease
LEVGAEQIRPADAVSNLGSVDGEPDAEVCEPSLIEQQAEEQGIEPEAEVVLEGMADMNTWDAVRYILRVRTNVALIIATGLGYFFLTGLQTFGALFVRDRYGVGQSLASVLVVVVAAGAIGGVLVGGRSADRLIERGRTDGRMVVAAIAFGIAAVIFVPGAISTSIAVSLPIFVVVGAALGAVNPPADSARLDVVPARLWGRAESVRTVLRTGLQGLAPLIFGLLSSALGGHAGRLTAGVAVTSAQASAASGRALELTFIILSSTLGLAGIILWVGRVRYISDIVAARRSHVAIHEEVTAAVTAT